MFDPPWCRQKKELTEKLLDRSRPNSISPGSKFVSFHDPATTTAGNAEKKKSGCFPRVLKCFRRNCQVAPSPDDKAEKKNGRLFIPLCCNSDKDIDRRYLPDWVDDVHKFKEDKEEEKEMKDLEKKVEKKEPQAVNRKKNAHIISSRQDWLGFPNLAQTCYMNSSLQSLITLKDFIRDFSSQEAVWTSVPQAELIRRFMNVVRCHRSVDSTHKCKALISLKEVVSLEAPEFRDHRQKDAHEFLTTVVDRIRTLSPLLQEAAAIEGRSYSCPVEDHLVFKMQNTRTCKSCGAGPTREEDFTNLSLNLLPRRSVQEMLQDYLKETELDFRCNCGGNASGQQSAFVTLPKVLMLHLKRFCYTPFLQLEKLSDPVGLFRELLVTSGQAEVWYSLVSIISHFGSGPDSGHYMCDGVNPDVGQDDPADSWLTYDDSRVTRTSGGSVCNLRQRTAYILFYQRRM